MIKYVKGNLLDVTKGIIVHGCNAQGVMGAGVARVIKLKYPECFMLYKEYCDLGYNNLGEIIWYRVKPDLHIVNAITQKQYGRDKRHVNYAAITNVFSEVVRNAKALNLSIHFPKIGAGLGGGDWNIIEMLINDCDPDDTVEKICWEL